MNEHIQRLDASLRKRGEDIIIRRKVAGVDRSVTVRARVRNDLLNASALGPGVQKTPATVIMSLTQIRAAGWPEGAPPPLAAPFNVDPAIPAEGDAAIIKGKLRTIKSVNAIAVDDEVVRIEFIAEG